MTLVELTQHAEWQLWAGQLQGWFKHLSLMNLLLLSLSPEATDSTMWDASRSCSAQRHLFRRAIFFPCNSLLSWVIYNSLHTHERCFWSFQFALQAFLSSLRALCGDRTVLFREHSRRCHADNVCCMHCIILLILELVTLGRKISTTINFSTPVSKKLNKYWLLRTKEGSSSIS